MEDGGGCDCECAARAAEWLAAVIGRYVAELAIERIPLTAELPVAGVLTDLALVAGLPEPLGSESGVRRVGRESLARVRLAAGGATVEPAERAGVVSLAERRGG